MLTWNKLTLLVEKITKQYNYDLHRIIIQFILKHEFAVFQAPMSVEVCLRKLTSVSPAEHRTHWEKKLHLRTFVNMRPESEIPLPLPEPVFGPSLHLPFGSLSQSLFLSHTHTDRNSLLPFCWLFSDCFEDPLSFFMWLSFFTCLVHYGMSIFDFYIKLFFTFTTGFSLA